MPLPQKHLDFLKLADRNLLTFAAAFFAEAFTSPFCPKIHVPLAKMIDAPGYTFKAGAAPRGTGKSTIGNTVNVIRRIAMRRSKYVLIVSNTYDQAAEHLDSIKHQLDGNELLVRFFGELRGTKWTENIITLTNGVKIRALGSGQEVRGRRSGWDRPDYILLDDFESQESVDSETSLTRISNWRASDLINSMSMDNPELLNLGTVLGDRSILESDLNDPTVLSVRLELFDDNYKSHWPERYSDQWVEERRAKAVYDGKLDKFWSDYRNIAMARENQKFKAEWFKYWNPKNFNPFDLPRFIIVDPARTQKKTSDYSAVCVVGIKFTGEVYCIDYDNDRKVNEALYDQIIKFAKQYQVNWIYVETNGLEDYITAPLRKFLIRNGHMAWVEGVHATGVKEDRMMGLLPLYKMGQIYHNPYKHHELESQLQAFPKSKFDDLHDCFSYVNKIMTDRNIGMYPNKEQVYEGKDEMYSGSAI